MLNSCNPLTSSIHVLVLLLLLQGILVHGQNGVCVTQNEEPCIFKSDAAAWMKRHFSDGDPCFSVKGFKTKLCFYTPNGHVKSCDCSLASCACDRQLAPPKEPCEDYPLPRRGCSRCSKYDGLKYREYVHTMCDDRYCGVNTDTCGKVCLRGSELTDADKQFLLDEHNRLRAIVARGEEERSADGAVQPAATNMNELVWDDDLAQVAQNWADQCSPGHDKNRLTPEFDFWVGQNFASGGLSKFQENHLFEYLIQLWYDEVADMPTTNVAHNAGYGVNQSVIGHYTQMVWATTKKVGCGFIKYVKAVDRPDGKRVDMYFQGLVCNYGPGGNWRSVPIYDTDGATGQKCPNGVHTEGMKKGLCKA